MVPVTPNLTDDEIVALVVDRGLVWAGLLPTVDSLDESALAGAALRGQRSLFVRQLIPDEIDDLVVKCAQGVVVVAAYHQDAAGDILLGSSALYVFQSGHDLLLDVVSPLGVHFLEESSSQAALERVEQVLGDTALTDDTYPPTASLAVYVRTMPTPVLFSVRADSIHRRPADASVVFASAETDLREALVGVLLSGES